MVVGLITRAYQLAAIVSFGFLAALVLGMF